MRLIATFLNIISIFLLLSSCSHPALSLKYNSNRSPSSSSICEEAFLGIERSRSHKNGQIDIVDHFFLKNPQTKNHINYQINFDRVEKYVSNLETRFPNQLSVQNIGKYDGKTLHRIDLPGWGNTEKQKILITAGVHGNEAGGVGTLINILELFVYRPDIRNKFDIVFIPYMNPGGLRTNTRRLKNGVDLNRTFPGGKSPEQGPTKMIQENLKNESFELAMDLHEAPFRDKFFIIKMKENDNNLTRSVLDDIPQEYLVTSPNNQYPGAMYKSTPPGEKPYLEIPRNKAYTLYAPGEVSSSNKGTVKSFFHHELKTKYAYTLEGPGQFDLREKIDIYSNIVEGYFLKLP